MVRIFALVAFLVASSRPCSGARMDSKALSGQFADAQKSHTEEADMKDEGLEALESLSIEEGDFPEEDVAEPSVLAEQTETKDATALANMDSTVKRHKMPLRKDRRPHVVLRQRLRVRHSVEAFQDIICPFLSALIRERVLPVKRTYSKDELAEISIAAGLTIEQSEMHIQGNFKNNPSGQQDIFDMEGAVNEHKTSTGIHDCRTTFTNCKKRHNGFEGCDVSTPVKQCGVPNRRIFNQFWRTVDLNRDGWLSKEELRYATEHPNGFVGHIVDTNPIGSGDVRGSFNFLIDIFGVDKDRIRHADLFAVSIQRRFPRHFTKLDSRRPRHQRPLFFSDEAEAEAEAGTQAANVA